MCFVLRYLNLKKDVAALFSENDILFSPKIPLIDMNGTALNIDQLPKRGRMYRQLPILNIHG
ncbi:MAG: hypothetical protein A3K45_01900 [Chloroflexi bacterium RIFOXYC12_FULL_59_14]|nr:MAG: hypothetical protein A3K45_01900 [Chloroflexi bacterium RIFOXYC12_FULL_59_14]